MSSGFPESPMTRHSSCRDGLLGSCEVNETFSLYGVVRGKATIQIFLRRGKAWRASPYHDRVLQVDYPKETTCATQ